MFSLMMFVFIIIALVVIGVLMAVVSFIGRARGDQQNPSGDPNVIDVQAIDVDEDQAVEITSTDQLLKP